MGKYYKALAVFFTFLPFYFFTLSCQEGGEAGDLLGNWRLTGSDTHYVAFSGSVTVMRTTDGRQVFGNFQHTGDSLFVQYYSIEGQPGDTLLVEQEFGFKPFSNIRVKIEALDADNLTMSKDGRQWSFYKY